MTTSLRCGAFLLYFAFFFFSRFLFTFKQLLFYIERQVDIIYKSLFSEPVVPPYKKRKHQSPRYIRKYNLKALDNRCTLRYIHCTRYIEVPHLPSSTHPPFLLSHMCEWPSRVWSWGWVLFLRVLDSSTFSLSPQLKGRTEASSIIISG